ncbi:MAG TPA: ZIP family metal transporter [Candidatus Bathyarchaeota archaeon]|nr:ZIP family metal transporter [Candidatus Bathyarchaeota archaeon]
MYTLLLALASTFLISLISLVGLFTLTLRTEVFDKILLILVGFASGSLLGGAFFHLIPEAVFSSMNDASFMAITMGIAVFFLLEKFLWRHCHEREKCPVHPFAYLNIIGDGIHNFIDGVIVAASFLTSVPLGITTSLAVVFHEIPQEIGDFAVLIYGGFTVKKALLYNLATAFTAMLGVLFTFAFQSQLPATYYLLGFAAGGFIYIASTDLIPELHKERKPLNSSLQFVALILGLVLMWLLKLYMH